LNKNTSSRVITQPNIIRQERNSSLNCNSSRYSDIPNIKSIYQRTSRKSPDNLKFKQNTSSMAITQPKVIRPERNSNLNYNSSRYSHIPNIKSIYQRTSKKSPDNLKFEQKIQVQWPELSQKSFDRNKFELKL
jgi:hypothetical protein